MTPFYESPLVTIFCGDNAEIILPPESVDLIVTSPPYADARKKTYGGIAPDKYVEWFLPRSQEFFHCLKPTGSFVLNIKEKVVDGERHTYVLDLIRALRQQGWLWTEEYIWHKKTCAPGKWPNRFRDAWERCLHFTKQREFAMYQDAVMVPAAEVTKKRAAAPVPSDFTRHENVTQSGFGVQKTNWAGREFAYPTNVVHCAAECGNKKHSAAFPEALPEFFIKLFTKKGDLVFDPFLGSGTTAAVAQRLERECAGIDLLLENCRLAAERVAAAQPLKEAA